MAKKIIWIAIVVIIIGGFLFWRNSKNKASNAPAISGNAVTYTDAGFSPSSLQIKVGDTVTFTNDSSGGMWVASNPHPTHTDLPGFDAKRIYGQGESYSFTFTTPGDWGFHNHVNPSQGGTIIVK